MVIAKKKKKIRYKNAAVYFYNKEHNAILVHQRAKAEKKFPYTILTPGGKKEKTDKNIKETAIREIREETGIEIKEDELVEIGSTNTTKYFLPLTLLCKKICNKYSKLSSLNPGSKLNSRELLNFGNFGIKIAPKRIRK